MAIIDEPVRGSIPPPWWWSLSGLERIQALSRGLLPLPPLCRLTGIHPGHVGPGACTWTMPASGWLQGPSGDLEITPLIEAALTGAAMTALPPATTADPVTLDLNHFRPIRRHSGSLIASARVINTNRFFVFADVQVEDAQGRQLMYATSHLEITEIKPAPPPPPAALAPVDVAVYATPDPYLRPVEGVVRSKDDWREDPGLTTLQSTFARGASPPNANLFGFDLLLEDEARLLTSMRASEWLCLFSRNVSPGTIALILPPFGAIAANPPRRQGQSFVGLSHHLQFHRRVPADGQLLRAEATRRNLECDYMNGSMELRDEEGHVVASAVGLARFVDSAKRQKPTATPAKRMLCTLLFTDIVGSTQHAEGLGDKRWRALLEEHWRVVRMEVDRWRGMEINTTGDGFFVRFDSPADALDCAVAAREAVKPLGIEIRAGIHTGECEVTGRNFAGMAVHIGARIQAAAGPSEIFVSSTVKDLVMGSGRNFTDRGEHELKGVPGAWRLYALA